MGRKARYKKYKAVDPFCTGERKELLQRQRNVFNRAPAKEDFEQKAPKGFQEIMDSMNEMKTRREQMAQRKKKKKKNDDFVEERGGSTYNKRTRFQRKPWESDKQFLGRVDRMAMKVIDHEKMEIMKSGGDQEQAPKKLTKEKERKLKRLKKKAAEAKTKKLEEEKEYATKVRNEKMLESLEKEMMQDHVRFGEVVMGPPVLTTAPRKSQETSKPGQRELILKGLLDGAAPRKQPNQPVKKTKTKRNHSELDTKKAKRRKNMSALEKMRFDQTRNKAIEAYRIQRNTERIVLPLPTDEHLR